MDNRKKKCRITLNAPAILVFTFLCFVVMILDQITKHESTNSLFSVYSSSLLNPLTYVRFIGHVFGHADWEHLMGNIMYILILGPLLEEKYGTSNMWFIILATALVTGLIHFFCFPAVRLLGASGVVFAMILLASITGMKNNDIPVTFILVAVLYIGQQLYQAFTMGGNISYMAHIVGGTVGAILGFLLNRWKMNRY